MNDPSRIGPGPGIRLMVLVAGVMLLGLAGCYPGGPEDTSDIGLVLTLKDPEGNFQGLKTYGMEDVVHMLDDPASGSSSLDPRFNLTILDELQAQMAAAGFARVADPGTGANKPDVWLSVGAVETEVWVYSTGWGGYPGYGWDGYYPDYVSTASFPKGTVVWHLYDLRGIEDPTADEVAPPVIWLGALSGALTGTANATEASIAGGIIQAFAQSPYVAGSGTAP